MYIKKEDYVIKDEQEKQAFIETAKFILKEGTCYNDEQSCSCCECPFGNYGAKDFDCGDCYEEDLLKISKEFLGYFNNEKEESK